jgi:hypothetical protein
MTVELGEVELVQKTPQERAAPDPSLRCKQQAHAKGTPLCLVWIECPLVTSYIDQIQGSS